MQGERKAFHHSCKNWRGEVFVLFRFLAKIDKGIFPLWERKKKSPRISSKFAPGGKSTR
jgi:hypothetical protein